MNFMTHIIDLIKFLDFFKNYNVLSIRREKSYPPFNTSNTMENALILTIAYALSGCQRRHNGKRTIDALVVVSFEQI